MLKTLLFISILIIATTPGMLWGAAAVDNDKASMNGYVEDNATGETLIGASVYLYGTSHGAYTNKLGFYSISNVPPGKYVVIVSSIGYEKLKTEITLKKGITTRKKFELKPTGVLKEAVKISAEKEIEKRQITVSKVNVPVEQLKQIRIGGEADVFRSLQYLPGVLTSSQISSGLFVRGGSPDQNLVLVDGTKVYNPSHLFGFISTFNADAIKDVELIKGGYPAEYGGRLSSVLNMTQIDGNRKEFGGLLSLGMISSRASLEGPLGRGSWFIGGRRTYLELMKEMMADGDDLPDFVFYDINAKLTQDITDDDKFFMSVFLSADNMGFLESGMDMDMDVGNQCGASRWTHIFGDNLFSTLNLSYSKYKNTFKMNNSGYEMVIDNSIQDITAKGGIDWFLSDDLTGKLGFESTYYKFSYFHDMTSSEARDSSDQEMETVGTDINEDDWTHSLYTQMNYMVTEDISVQAGLRMNYWDYSERVTWDPRLAIRWQVDEFLAIKGATGLFHQYLRLASNPDFTFFDTWLPTDNSIATMSAEHYIFSLESEPWGGFDFNLDFYYKKMHNINEINPNIYGPQDRVGDVFYVGEGTAYGIELFIQKKYGKFVGWFGYAYGVVEAKYDSINYNKTFNPKYDRTHDLKLVLQYEMNERWQFGASFTFQSGQPYTPSVGTAMSSMPGDTDFKYKSIPGEKNSLRLPPSHQLNLNASYGFKFFGQDAKLIMDIYNVYSRRDIWFRVYREENGEINTDDIKLLPIIPSLSFEMSF